MSISLIITLLVSGLMTCIVVIFFLFFYAGRVIIPYISARISGVPALFMQMKHGGYRLIKGKGRAGTLKTKYGSYNIIPESTQNFEGIKIGLAYEGAGSAVTPEFIKASKNLKKKGILDIVQAKLFKKEAPKFLKDESITEEEKQEIEDTLRDISVIDDFFLRKTSPILTEELISNEVLARQEKFGKDKVFLATGIGFAVFLILIGLYLLSTTRGGACPTPPDYASVCRSMAGLTQNTTVVRSSIF